MIRPNIVSRSKTIVEQHFSLTEQRLKVLAKTLSVVQHILSHNPSRYGEIWHVEAPILSMKSGLEVLDPLDSVSMDDKDERYWHPAGTISTAGKYRVG
jgi:hypothetical protein